MSEQGALAKPATEAVLSRWQVVSGRGREMAAAVQRRASLWVDSTLPRALSRVRATGTTGLTGLALIAFGAIFTWTVLLPQRDSLDSLRDAVSAAEASGGEPGVALPAPSRQARDFVSQLPTRSELPALVGVILAQAEANGLVLETGSYEWHAGQKAGMGQYRITLPLQGSYPRIRRFVEGTLVAAPAIGLESLRFSRENVADGAVAAEVSFVVFARDS